MDGLSTHIQVGGDGFGVPPIDMEPNDGASPGFPILHFHIAWVAAFSRRGLGARGQNELNSCRCRLAVKFHEADGGDLMGTEDRILRIQVDDLLPDIGRKRTLIKLWD